MKHINKIGYFFLRNNLKIPNLFSKNFISFYEKSFLKNLIYKEKINCVLDVGSHRGSFIKSLRSMGYNGQIVSFEPTLTNYNYQRENFQNDKKIRFYNLALGDINCEQKINIMDLSNMNSLLEPINKKIKNKINVKVKRLDSLMNDILEPIKNPKIFCKIDTQGYDLNVLKGAVKFTKFFRYCFSQ